MRKIKRYANGRLYDTARKEYITRDRLKELLVTGEELSIVESKSEKDITAEIVSELLGTEKKKQKRKVPSPTAISDLLKKGSGTISEYADKYAAILQSAMSMAEDEVDKFVSVLVKNKEISSSDGNKLKNELMTYSNKLRDWMSIAMDQRIKKVLSVMNLATKEEVLDLTSKLDTLIKKIKKLEKLQIK